MTGTRVRKRIHWRTPLLLGLVAALLAALFSGPAPARAALGDVTHNIGYCIPETTTEGALVHLVRPFPGLTSIVRVTGPDGGQLWFPCPAAYAGLPVRITPNGTAAPDVALIHPSVTISIDGYPENQIPADGQASNLRISYHNFVQLRTGNTGLIRSTVIPETAPLAENFAAIEGVQHSVHLDFVRAESVPGVVAPLVPPAVRNIDHWGQTQPPDPLSRPRSLYFPGFYVIPGTTGEFTVTARVDYDRNVDASNFGDHVTVYASQTFTIVDPSVNNLSEAEWSLFGAVDNPLTSADETRDGVDKAAAAGGDIWLKLEARNADGERSKEIRLQSITVFALGGTINLFAPDASGAPTLPILNMPADGSVTINASAGPPRVLVPATLFVQLTKSDGMAGEVEVQGIVTGDDNTVTSETLTVTFTGPAAKLALGGDAQVGQPSAGDTAKTEIALSGTDAAGNAVATPANVSYAITDADGNAVGAAMIDAMNSTIGASTDTERDDNPNAAAVLITVGESVEPGVYTLTASLPDVDDSSDTATLTISGPPANLSLSADKTASTAIGEVITATATVTDADGVAVADGSEVTFTLTGNALVAIGTDANPNAAGTQSRTVGGEASARFTTIGAGSSVIVASVGGQSAVVVVGSSATSAASAATSGADCLSSQRGLASWACDAETSAADLFAELAADGVTALHLFNGNSWVFYALVDGRRVPGSTNFTILKRDILYIGR